MNTLPALVQFLKMACFSLVVDTWCKAIDAGYFTTWTGLTSKLVRKHLPKSIETAKGQDIPLTQPVNKKPTHADTSPPAHTPIYEDGRNYPLGEPCPRKPGMYAAGQCVRPDLFGSNRPIPQSLQQGVQVSDSDV